MTHAMPPNNITQMTADERRTWPAGSRSSSVSRDGMVDQCHCGKIDRISASALSSRMRKRGKKASGYRDTQPPPALPAGRLEMAAWDRGEESLCIGVLWGAEHSPRWRRSPPRRRPSSQRRGRRLAPRRAGRAWMNTIERPSRVRRSASSLSTCALHRDVERGDGFVRHQHIGLERKRRARPIRWRWTAENSCRIALGCGGVQPDHAEQFLRASERLSAWHAAHNEPLRYEAAGVRRG